MIVRGDGVGDALALAPLVAALRDAGHDLSAVLGVANAEVYAPGTFTRTHVLDRVPWPAHGSTRLSYRTALAEARAARYDLALIASEEPEAYRFARAARIARRTGFTTGLAKPLKTLLLRPLLTRALTRAASANDAAEHEIVTLFRLGAGLHDEPGPTRELARLRPLVVPGAAGEGAPPSSVVVQYPRRRAGADADTDAARLRGFLALVRAVRERYETLVVGARADRPALEAVSRALEMPCFGFDALPAWVAEIARARALVTCDGGAAHVAGMTGVPCVDLFPATAQTAADVRRWHPWAAPYRTLVAGPVAGATAAAAVEALAELIGEAR